VLPRALRPQLKRDPLGRGGTGFMARPSPCSALVLVLAVSGCGRAPGPIREIAGCYSISLGPWDVHRLTYDHPRSPPDTVRLGTAAVLANGEARGFEVRPNIFASTPHREIPPTWQRTVDSVKVTWTDGFTGVRLSLVRTDSGLVGRAHSWTDVIVSEEVHGRQQQIPWPTASVHLRRSRCAREAAA